MKYQVNKQTQKIVSIFYDSQDVESWDIDKNKYDIVQSIFLYSIDDQIRELTPDEKKDQYNQEVIKRIRLKYSSDDEDKIKREAINNILKNTITNENMTEFNTYNLYVESIKEEVKKIMRLV